LLLHLCLHASYTHSFAFGLRNFCDIAAAIDRLGPVLDWSTIATRACDHGGRRGVYLALRLALELAGASVPLDILERLHPADLPGTILETARIQVLGEKKFAASVPEPLAQLCKSRRVRDKFRIFWRRVFLPRTIIALLHSVPEDSLRIYTCYPRRFCDCYATTEAR